MQPITTFLSFKENGKAAVEFYCSVFKDSTIDHIMTYPDSDKLLHAGFSLNGVPFMAIDAGDHPGFVFTDAISLFVACKDQAEVDYYWEALLADGGETQACGWLKDRYGVRWQIIPNRLMELMSDPDPEKSGRVMNAMLAMIKIDIPTLETAYSNGGN